METLSFNDFRLFVFMSDHWSCVYGIPICGYWESLSWTKYIELMANSNACNISFVAHIHIRLDTSHRFYNNKIKFIVTLITTSIVRSQAYMLRYGIYCATFQCNGQLRFIIEHERYLYLYAGTGNAWAGHSKLISCLSRPLTICPLSAMFTFGLTLPTGSRTWTMQELISWDSDTVNAFECALNMNIGKGAPVNYLSNRCEIDI